MTIRYNSRLHHIGRLDVHPASPLDVLQQLPREFLPLKELRGLKRGRRACQRIGIV
jgi:hypothetical protein